MIVFLIPFFSWAAALEVSEAVLCKSIAQLSVDPVSLAGAPSSQIMHCSRHIVQATDSKSQRAMLELHRLSDNEDEVRALKCLIGIPPMLVIYGALDYAQKNCNKHMQSIWFQNPKRSLEFLRRQLGDELLNPSKIRDINDASILLAFDTLATTLSSEDCVSANLLPKDVCSMLESVLEGGLRYCEKIYESCKNLLPVINKLKAYSLLGECLWQKGFEDMQKKAEVFLRYLKGHEISSGSYESLRERIAKITAFPKDKVQNLDKVQNFFNEIIKDLQMFKRLQTLTDLEVECALSYFAFLVVCVEEHPDWFTPRVKAKILHYIQETPIFMTLASNIGPAYAMLLEALGVVGEEPPLEEFSDLQELKKSVPVQIEGGRFMVTIPFQSNLHKTLVQFRETVQRSGCQDIVTRYNSILCVGLTIPGTLCMEDWEVSKPYQLQAVSAPQFDLEESTNKIALVEYFTRNFMPIRQLHHVFLLPGRLFKDLAIDNLKTLDAPEALATYCVTHQPIGVDYGPIAGLVAALEPLVDAQLMPHFKTILSTMSEEKTSAF